MMGSCLKKWGPCKTTRDLAPIDKCPRGSHTKHKLGPPSLLRIPFHGFLNWGRMVLYSISNQLKSKLWVTIDSKDHNIFFFFFLPLPLVVGSFLNPIQGTQESSAARLQWYLQNCWLECQPRTMTRWYGRFARNSEIGDVKISNISLIIEPNKDTHRSKIIIVRKHHLHINRSQLLLKECSCTWS
jgi:hypothetical protein